MDGIVSTEFLHQDYFFDFSEKGGFDHMVRMIVARCSSKDLRLLTIVEDTLVSLFISSMPYIKSRFQFIVIISK